MLPADEGIRPSVGAPASPRMTRPGLCHHLAHSEAGAGCGPGASEGSAEVEERRRVENGFPGHGLLITLCDFFQPSG